MFIPMWVVAVVAVWGLWMVISASSSVAPNTPEQQRENDRMYLKYGVTPPSWTREVAPVTPAKTPTSETGRRYGAMLRKKLGY